MLEVIYHTEAQAELIEAAKFYNDRVPGLGADLLREIDRAVARIFKHRRDGALWRKIFAVIIFSVFRTRSYTVSNGTTFEY